LQAKAGSVDVPGALLSVVAIAALMLMLTEAGAAGPAFWMLASGTFVAGSVLFVVQERRTPDPIVSFELWRRRQIATSNGVAFLSNMTLIGLTTCLPLKVQAVMSQSEVVAGLTLTVIMIGWPVGATIAARLYLKVGPRRLMLVGSLLMPVGAGILVAVGSDSPPAAAGLGSLVMGLGMGLMNISALMVIQNSVELRQRGSATASVLFARNLGSTLGAAVFGGLLNLGLARAEITVGNEELRRLLEHTLAPTAADLAARAVLEAALHLSFVAMLVLAVANVAAALLVPDPPAEAYEPSSAPPDP
jgi:MFS family permease